MHALQVGTRTAINVPGAARPDALLLVQQRQVRVPHAPLLGPAGAVDVRVGAELRLHNAHALALALTLGHFPLHCDVACCLGGSH